MKRIEAIALAAQAAQAEGALLVCNIGYPSRELYSLLDRPENFYMLGSMGLASSIGLGLSLARPERRVMVLDGDGSVLMNLGTLATIAHHGPANLLLIILDNGCYGSTGSQPTCTSLGTDLAALAGAAGIENVQRVESAADLATALSWPEGKPADRNDRGPHDRRACSRAAVIVATVEPGNASVPIIDLSPQEIIDRFNRCARPAGPS